MSQTRRELTNNTLNHLDAMVATCHIGLQHQIESLKTPEKTNKKSRYEKFSTFMNEYINELLIWLQQSKQIPKNEEIPPLNALIEARNEAWENLFKPKGFRENAEAHLLVTNATKKKYRPTDVESQIFISVSDQFSKLIAETLKYSRYVIIQEQELASQLAGLNSHLQAIQQRCEVGCQKLDEIQISINYASAHLELELKQFYSKVNFSLKAAHQVASFLECIIQREYKETYDTLVQLDESFKSLEQALPERKAKLTNDITFTALSDTTTKQKLMQIAQTLAEYKSEHQSISQLVENQLNDESRIEKFAALYKRVNETIVRRIDVELNAARDQLELLGDPTLLDSLQALEASDNRLCMLLCDVEPAVAPHEAELTDRQTLFVQQVSAGKAQLTSYFNAIKASQGCFPNQDEINKHYIRFEKAHLSLMQRLAQEHASSHLTFRNRHAVHNLGHLLAQIRLEQKNLHEYLPTARGMVAEKAKAVSEAIEQLSHQFDFVLEKAECYGQNLFEEEMGKIAALRIDERNEVLLQATTAKFDQAIADLSARVGTQTNAIEKLYLSIGWMDFHADLVAERMALAEKLRELIDEHHPFKQDLDLCNLLQIENRHRALDKLQAVIDRYTEVTRDLIGRNVDRRLLETMQNPGQASDNNKVLYLLSACRDYEHQLKDHSSPFVRKRIVNAKMALIRELIGILENNENPSDEQLQLFYQKIGEPELKLLETSSTIMTVNGIKGKVFSQQISLFKPVLPRADENHPPRPALIDDSLVLQ